MTARHPHTSMQRNSSIRLAVSGGIASALAASSTERRDLNSRATGAHLSRYSSRSRHFAGTLWTQTSGFKSRCESAEITRYSRAILDSFLELRTDRPVLLPRLSEAERTARMKAVRPPVKERAR